MWKGKRVLLGVSGSIAAYKSVFLLRTFQKKGAEVKVIPTRSSLDFVGKITWSSLTGHEIFSDIQKEGTWNQHVSLGSWADYYIIAPCTAQTLHKLALGGSPDMLSAVYLSARCPVYIAPAMDLDMWKHPATQRNLKMVENDGVRILHPDTGYLASGLNGEGRLMEPEDIIAVIEEDLGSQILKDKRVLITAGPTRERLDPVRFISNFSSGKMGRALAEASLKMGAKVTVVYGPGSESMPAKAEVIRVESTREMYDETKKRFSDADIVIFAAAVSDYSPAKHSERKIKTGEEKWQLELKQNPDIAATLSQEKTKDQITVGFALETDNAEENAEKKLRAKFLDFIVLNSLENEGAGFEKDTNEVTVISRKGEVKDFPMASKLKIAYQILKHIVNPA